ncbi:uncharacterized protein [Parasteatoda tepidariorum]|uniref:uncharacterized protein n=1 Tax=Parasteatoda tepidariorum TaxID=114398 RepID=UPI0039BD6D84
MLEFREVEINRRQAIRRRLVALPPPTASTQSTSSKSNLEQGWKQKNSLLERIWKKWKSSYLLELRTAHQLKRQKENVLPTKDSTVLVYDEKLPRLMWKMGIVTCVHPGRDGKTRSCTIRLSNGTNLKRPVQLLYPCELG